MHLAISTRLSSISVCAHLPPPLLRAVQLAIVKAVHTSPRGAYKLIEKGQPIQLPLAKWKMAKKYAIPKPIEGTQWLCQSASEQARAPDEPINAFNITCPNCASTSNHIHHKLWNGQRNKWLAIPCGTCKGKVASSRWKCECDMLWHKCPIHRRQGMLCRNLKALAGTIRRQHSSVQTATKRRTTVAVNTSLCHKQRRPRGSEEHNHTSQVHSVDTSAVGGSQGSIWDQAAERLSNRLAATPLRLKAMPPDGDCFYHAVS